MEKRISSCFFWSVIALLLAINAALIGVCGWQFQQNQSLRRQLASTATNPGGPGAEAYVKLYSDQDYKGEVLTLIPWQAAPEKLGFRGDISFLVNVPPDNATSRDFNDKASSVVYFLPKGWKVVLFADANFQNTQLELVGTGDVERIRDLREAAPPFNDNASSLRWVQQ